MENLTFGEIMGVAALLLAAVAIVVIALQARHSGNAMKEIAQFVADRRGDKVWLDAAERVGVKLPAPATNVASGFLDLAGKLLPEEYTKIAGDLQAILQMVTDGQPNYTSEGAITDSEAKG